VAFPPAPETVVVPPFASPEVLDVVLVVELVLPPVSPPRAPSPPVVVDALLIWPPLPPAPVAPELPDEADVVQVAFPIRVNA
jgi:hypothetical protein